MWSPGWATPRQDLGILEDPFFFHAVIFMVANDHMIENGDAQELSGLFEAIRQVDILFTGTGISTGVVMG